MARKPSAAKETIGRRITPNHLPTERAVRLGQARGEKNHVLTLLGCYHFREQVLCSQPTNRAYLFQLRSRG